jgi:hypothetical protein
MKKVMVLLAVVAMASVTMAFHPDENCEECHLPHDAKTNAVGEQIVPLWSGVGYAGTTFVLYNSDSMDATAQDPEGPTLLCLACHDNSHGTKHDINPDVASGDLSGTHPMEFVYDAGLVALDNELKNPDAAGSSTVVNGYGNITQDLLSATFKVNCQSCHEIHANGLHGLDVDYSGTVEEQDTDPVTGDLLFDPVTGDPIMVDVPVSGTFSFDIPHLVDIPGITYETGWGGDDLVENDYSLSYGVICRTCHIK